MDDMRFVENTLPDSDAQASLLRKYCKIPPISKVLLICFALPTLMMTIVYFCLMVWPLGENSVLVLDLNAQYVYYFEKLRNIIVSGDSILYSFERALGGEFMGIFAYYLSSPLSILVALLPKSWMTESIFLLLVIKTGLCGLTFGYYLIKTRHARPIWAIMFSAMYALCSYVVVLQHNVMWMDNVILFPIILYGMDLLIREGRFRLYVASLAVAVLSNFYIGYMTCLFLAVYFFIRYFTMTPEEKGFRHGKKAFVSTLLRMVLYSFLAVLIASVIILPVYYSLSFGKLDFSTPNFSPRQLFDFIQLLTKMFFGSYDTVRPAGMPFLYGGTLMLLMLPLYFAAPAVRLRHKVGTLITLAFLVLGFNFSVLDIIWHGFQRPNWLNARFAFMFVCIAMIAAYDGFVHLKDLGVRKILPCAIGAIGILILVQALGYDNVEDFLTVWAGIFFICVLAVLVPYALRDRAPGDISLFTNHELILVAFVVFELICNGVLMGYCLDDDVAYTSRSGYRDFVDQYAEGAEKIAELDAEKYGENSLYRAEKTKHKKKNDNFAVDINGLSNSTSTLNAKAVAFLADIGLSARSHWSMYYGGNVVTDSFLGLRYLMVGKNATKPEYLDQFYTLLATTEGGVEIYENPLSLGIAFAVSDNILTYAEYDAELDRKLEEAGETYVRQNYADAVEYTTPFEYYNHMFSSMLGYDVEIFTPVYATESGTKGASRIFTTGHHGYEKSNPDGTASVEYTLTIEEDLPVYWYIPSTYPREVTIKLNNEVKGDYFEDDSFCIQQLGALSQGKHTFSIHLVEEKLYMATGCDYFWYFHEDVFREVVAYLSNGVLDAYSTKDDAITGTITVSEGMNTIFTTIPYDEGWEVYVDGELVEIRCLLDTMLGFTAPEGEHTVEMYYRPSCVKYGLILTLSACALFACLSYFDVYRRTGITPSDVMQECRRFLRRSRSKQ